MADHPPDDPPERPPLLFQLVYCSRATPGVDDEAVHRILRSARRHNPADGITGLLVFGSGIFFQWLEGPRERVNALLERLQADARHADIVVLDTSEEVRDRLFPAWGMELVGACEIRDVLQDALDSTASPGSAATLRRLLQQLDDGALSRLVDL